MALAVIPILLVALGLRLWNLQFGLPDWYHPDEPLKARAIARIASGDLHPGSFYHPSFMLYASALVLRAQHPRGDGIDEQSAVRAGRLTVALLGSATVALTYVAGVLSYGAPAGLVAALLLALAPLHVVCSHYLKEDVPLTLWAVATFLASLRVVTRGAARDVSIAAFLAGVATGTKYTGLLFLALPWLALRQRGERAGARILIAAAAGFLVTTPFALIDLPGFVLGAGHEGGNAVTGFAGIRVWPFAHLWTYHLRFSLLPGFGALPLLAALAGLAVAWRRRNPADRLLLVTAIGLYLVCETSPYKPPPNADRYVVPLLPFLALLAAAPLQRASTFGGHRFALPGSADPSAGGFGPQAEALPSTVTVVALGLLVVGPLGASIRLVAAMQPDTRAMAAQWLQEHACDKGRIVLEGALNAGGTMVVSYVPALPASCNATYVYSLAREREALENPDFIVASSFMYERFLRFRPSASPERQFYEALFADSELLAEFAAADRSYGFHNPTIRIYRGAHREAQ